MSMTLEVGASRPLRRPGMDVAKTFPRFATIVGRNGALRQADNLGKSWTTGELSSKRAACATQSDSRRSDPRRARQPCHIRRVVLRYRYSAALFLPHDVAGMNVQDLRSLRDRKGLPGKSGIRQPATAIRWPEPHWRRCESCLVYSDRTGIEEQQTIQKPSGAGRYRQVVRDRGIEVGGYRRPAGMSSKCVIK